MVDQIVELRTKLREPVWMRGRTPSGGTLHTTTECGCRAPPSAAAAKAGLVTPQPQKKPRSSYIRFEADQPNECWQSDFTHYRLVTASGAPGTHVEILSWLDDHSRKALSVTAHRRITGRTVLGCFREAVAIHGVPASTLTDNGMVFTTRLAGGRGGRNAFESELYRLGVHQKNSRPNHPTTCGKVERFQQTMKKWLRAQPRQPSSIDQLQALIDEFVDHYNERRPHRSLAESSTPTTAYLARPKGGPGPAGPIPTIGCAGTESTRPGRSPCACTANSTTSASGGSTPEPTSSCSSTNSTYGSSRPPPASYCGTSR